MPNDDDQIDEQELDNAENEFDEDEITEISLDDLGRAYAKAIGLEPKTPELFVEPEEEAVENPKDVADADNKSCPVSPKSILEAILFVGSPTDVRLTSRKIASLMRDVSPKEVTALTKELNKEYEEQNSAFRIVNRKNDLQLQLVEELEPIRQAFYGEVRIAKLSQSSIDVLSIVAYNQPITKKDVEKLRTLPCGPVLNQLVKRQLLELIENPANKREKLYQTSDRFLELFGLESLSDLPRADSDLELEL